MWLKLTLGEYEDGKLRTMLANLGPGSRVTPDINAEKAGGAGSIVWGDGEGIYVKESIEQIWAMLEPERTTAPTTPQEGGA